MSIWFYLFLATLVFAGLLLWKILAMKREINSIIENLPTIVNSDTNRLLTTGSADAELKRLFNSLNDSLKTLRKMELEYLQGNRELKSSITNISHDLRTPLTAIRGYLDLMGSTDLSNKEKKYLSIIKAKVDDLTELTEQLFDFSKSLDLAENMPREDLYLNIILEETLASFYGELKRKNIEPKIVICEEKIVRHLNETMVKRIFENIISNAIKYGEGDFHVEMDRKGTIKFSNVTSALDKTSLAHIFDRYYTVKTAKKSVGLGLSIAKQLVELQGGFIKATYEKNLLTIEIVFSKSYIKHND